MDDRRILAEIERSLARDDPELATLMDALNQQFAERTDVIAGAEPGAGADADDEHTEHDWRWVTAVVLSIVAFLAIILTAMLAAPPPVEDSDGQLDSRAPAVSVSVSAPQRSI